ncbi:hypothetical protein VD0004_g9878 [Verticillium dahliae]|uniref:Uncharacterized protein n=1 Tax=Verticillium dahliae TaxID=27337 RepID=A0A444RIL5_VERDA|nr:hypothetical protein VD0004_g9878 [Verticillium dahliae]RXG41033.1 hypothetical protein VDGE_30320 [Verticillium dahliae]
MGDQEESSRHLLWLDPTESATASAVDDFPGLIRDIADALNSSGDALRALDYYELLRNSVYGQDPDLLLDLGRCHLTKGDTGAAEDCFLLTIQVDDSNIDARIELAKIYEDAREDEEALILVTEAIALQGAGEHAYRAVRGKTDAKFYTWDKYVKYLGASEGIVFNAPMETQYGTGTSELHELAERLSRNVAPSQGDDGRVHVPSDDDGHRGIPFGEWLELFLDFAISLALEGHGHEAYQVCEAARDSIVFVNSKDFMFLIHVAWAACAIYLGDEEMCVAMARFFTKVQQLDSDSYRMFAALSIPMPSTTFYGPARSTL